MQPVPMAAVIDGRVYDTDAATLIAHDGYWQGQNLERPGRTTYLFRMPDGTYFLEQRTAWHIEEDHIEPLTSLEALQLYEELPVREAPFSPGVPIRVGG